MRFHKATGLCGEDIAAVQRAVRRQVLRLFQRRDLLTPEVQPRGARNAGVDRLIGRGPEIEIDTRGATGRGAYP